MTVRRPGPRTESWEAAAGETRWVDYSHDRSGADLVIYAHTFRRVRERLDHGRDVLLWKPVSTAVAHTYTAGEWEEVVRSERTWPPTTPEYVARRPRHLALRRERRPRR